ncbi:MAG: tetratricopeptide repeat protein [Acidobacteriota bacterium]
MKRRHPSLSWLISSLTLALVLAGSVSPAVAKKEKKQKESFLTGQVKNQGGDKLKDVQIQIVTSEGEILGEAATDRKGKFEIKMPAGLYVVHFTAAGYAPFQGEVELKSGEGHELSVSLLDEATARRNRAIDAFNAGADAHRERNMDVALAKFQEAVEADPELTQPYLALADVYLQKGDAPAAVQAIERFRELDPENEQGKKLAFEAYRRAGKKDQATAMAKEIGAEEDFSKDLAIGIYNEGAVASQQGDSEKALAKFREAAEMDPSLAQARAGAAAILYNQENLAEALSEADKSLAVDPQNKQALRIRYLVLDAQGDLDQAFPAWEAYRALDQAGAVQLLYTRADLEFQAGRVTEARRALTKVLEVDPAYARAHYTMGLTYTSDDPVKAKEHLEKFLELAPEDSESATAREILSYL